jgi:hypothetical protein
MAKEKDTTKDLPQTGVPLSGGGDFLERLLAEDKPLGERIAYEYAQILNDRKHLLKYSDLTQEQRSAITRLLIVDLYYVKPYCEEGEEYFLRDLIDCLLELTVSNRRQGRSEAVDMVIGMRNSSAMLRMQKPGGEQGRHWWSR